MIKLLLILLSQVASADYLNLDITRETRGGIEYFCYRPFEKPLEPRECLAIQKLKPIEVPPHTSYPRIDHFAVTSLAEKGSEFVVTVDWKGKGSGLLSLDGPQGTMYVFGVHEKSGAVKIENFADASMTQQFDRSAVFGESESLALNVKTQVWLETVLVPVLEAYFKESVANSLR